MGLDKLNLTIYEPPDTGFLEEIGIVQEKGRDKIYKNFCNLGLIQVLWKPHKFGPELNERMAYTKLNCGPKHFSCFQELTDNLQNYFPVSVPISLDCLMVSRVDVKADRKIPS